MSSFPEGYRSIGFQYSERQPARTDEQKIAAHWREHNQALSEKNASRGRALREKNGDVPRLNDVYNLEADKQQQAARQAEIEASPYAIKWPMSMLPPNDPIRQEAKRKHFGLPTHEQEIAELNAYREGYDRLAKAIMEDKNNAN